MESAAGHRRAQSDAADAFTVADWAHERLRSFNNRKTGGAEGASAARGAFSSTSAASVAERDAAPSPRGRQVSIAGFAGSANGAVGGRTYTARSPSARARRASADPTDLGGAPLNEGIPMGKSEGTVKGKQNGEEEEFAENQQQEQEERQKQQQKEPRRQKKLVQASFVERRTGEAINLSLSLGGKEQLLLRGSKGGANQWRSTIDRRSPGAGGLVSPRPAADSPAGFEAGMRRAGEAGVAERGSVARDDRRDEKGEEKGGEKGGEKNEEWRGRKSPKGTKVERNFKEKGVRRDREDRRTRVEGDGAGRETMKERGAEGGWEERRKERREGRREEGTEEGREEGMEGKREEEGEEKRAGTREERQTLICQTLIYSTLHRLIHSYLTPPSHHLDLPTRKLLTFPHPSSRNPSLSTLQFPSRTPTLSLPLLPSPSRSPQHLPRC
ncbi:unnamed protein product [Closterium sp. NIES-65]|nr:unnamed protein product [Closterium sp. NIES-65]